VLVGFDVRFVTLKGVVEVVPKMLNKGLVVKNILGQVRDMEEDHGTDFILCVGDDVSDEKMFTAVFSFLAESSSPQQSLLAATAALQLGQPQQQVQPQTTEIQPSSTLSSKSDSSYAYTVTVGKKASHASYYVNGAADVASLLMHMTGQTSRTDGRGLSWDTEEREIFS